MDGEALNAMQLPNQTDEATLETVPPAETREPAVTPDFDTPLKPIADFVSRPDFPECVLGEHLDIGGYTGVVIAVVKQSIKVKSSEGALRSFKSYGLQRIYGRAPEIAPAVETPSPSFDVPKIPGESLKAAPVREIIEEPNFEQPVIAIAALLANPAFPKCAFGQHVEIGGYTGVVVELANQTLKVRSREGTSRNYNLVLLRNIYLSSGIAP